VLKVSVKKIKLITTLIYTLALAYFSLVPVPREFSETVKVNDIVQHFVAYFTLTFLWYLYWRKNKIFLYFIAYSRSFNGANPVNSTL